MCASFFRLFSGCLGRVVEEFVRELHDGARDELRIVAASGY